MDKVAIKLIVFFKKPFWIGVFEVNENDMLRVSNVIFGSEPNENEIYEYVLHNVHRLRFSPAISNEITLKKKNPKRMQRDAKKALLNKAIGTKSQQALKLQKEEIKMERKVGIKQNKQFEKERLFALKQQKRKDKHKGR